MVLYNVDRVVPYALPGLCIFNLCDKSMHSCVKNWMLWSGLLSYTVVCEASVERL